jgi:hypothetical protein
MNRTILIGIAAASVFVACGQGATGTWGPPERSSTTAQELTSVQDCVSQAQTCASGATSASASASCQQDLRACLAALCAEAGVPPIGSFDAGGNVPPVGGNPLDAGSLPPIGSFDAGLPPLPDASIPPVTLPDASLPPVTFPDGGSFPGSACIDALQACLASSSDPLSCASQVVTCLQQAL